MHLKEGWEREKERESERAIGLQLETTEPFYLIINFLGLVGAK